MASPTAGIVIVLALVSLTCGKPLQDETLELRMPKVQPKLPDTYLCNPTKLDENEPIYLTGFEPHANMSIAHHILLYGCEEPGQDDKVWDCGEMMTVEGSGFEKAPVCKTGAQIIYAWAMDAPKLELPKDVAFKVGGKTKVQWLVLQVHYKDVTSFLPPVNGKDSSGLTLTSTSVPQPKRAGVYLLGTGGAIPAHSTTYMETACGYSDPIEIHPFAFRVHAHTHGEVVAGYRVRNGEWEEIGRASPHKPQMFYPVTHPGIAVKPGDVLAARCTMVNKDDKEVAIGSTQNDEMCNFYIMYWVDGDKIMNENYCFSAGPPNWFWNNFEGLETLNIPNSASIVPGTDKLLKATEEFMQNTENTLEESNKDMEENFMHLLEEMQEQEQQVGINPMFERHGFEQGEDMMNGPVYRDANMVEENPGFPNEDWANDILPGYLENQFEEDPETYYEPRFNGN